jgi:hypothetical protein
VHVCVHMCVCVCVCIYTLNITCVCTLNITCVCVYIAHCTGAQEEELEKKRLQRQQEERKRAERENHVLVPTPIERGSSDNLEKRQSRSGDKLKQRAAEAQRQCYTESYLQQASALASSSSSKEDEEDDGVEAEDRSEWKEALELLRHRDAQRAVSAPTLERDSIGSTDEGVALRVSRGPCALCGYEVFTDQARERYSDGVRYMHVACPPSPVPSPSSAAAMTLPRDVTNAVSNTSANSREGGKERQTQTLSSERERERQTLSSRSGICSGT